ncbi:hydroxyacylglutathione hydrolase, mitochondrial-like [Mercenaria mercenaria]|uniref:hydroxyacylglutathione hydrolase, mitochondrial-like n=1 Tax=Mercenaria mercenaria TaxID=6596 RepID=UPI00234F533B|nr:hydroxyacylglutathione hydrolase, mitochondrial-like [Mercenaria mercenaria]
MHFLRRSVSVFHAFVGRNLLSRHHCRSTITQLDKMRIRLEPALKDNYMYLLIDETTGQCAAVDPVEPEKVPSQAVLSKIIRKMKQYSCIKICSEGSNQLIRKENGLSLTMLIFYNELVHLSVWTVPLTAKRGPNPEKTNIVPNFGLAWTPFLFDLKGICVFHISFFLLYQHSLVLYLKQKQRENDLPTIPSTIGEEKKINPFMRVRCTSVQKHASSTDPIEVMGFLRKEKDDFKPK